MLTDLNLGRDGLLNLGRDGLLLTMFKKQYMVELWLNYNKEMCWERLSNLPKVTHSKNARLRFESKHSSSRVHAEILTPYWTYVR